MDARLRGALAEDPTDDLLRMTSENFQQWAAMKARNADGLNPSLPLASCRAVLDALEEHADDLACCTAKFSRKSLDASRLARAGLLHGLTGRRCEQIASEMGVTNGTVSRWIRAHRKLVHQATEYSRITAAASKRAIEATHSRH